MYILSLSCNTLGGACPPVRSRRRRRSTSVALIAAHWSGSGFFAKRATFSIRDILYVIPFYLRNSSCSVAVDISVLAEQPDRGMKCRLGPLLPRLAGTPPPSLHAPPRCSHGLISLEVSSRSFLPREAPCPATRIDIRYASLATLGYQPAAQFDPTAAILRVKQSRTGSRKL